MINSPLSECSLRGERGRGEGLEFDAAIIAIEIFC